MRNLKKYICCCLFLLFFGISIGKSQEPIASMHLMVCNTQKQPNKIANAKGIGFDLNGIYYPSESSPFGFGGQLGIIWYGRNTQNETWKAQIKNDNVLIDETEIPIEIITKRKIIFLDAVVRLRAPTKFASLYIEGLAGLNYNVLDSEITDRSIDTRFSCLDDRVIFKERSFLDLGLAYGFGGGLMIYMGKTSENYDIWIDLRMDYRLGGKAGFYDARKTEHWEVNYISSEPYNTNTLSGDDLEINFKTKRYRTDYLIFSIGVSLLM